MHEQLIAELEKLSCNKSGCLCDCIYRRAASALREDAKTIAELRADNDRLRKAIENAKHENWCPAFSLSTIGGGIGADGVSTLEVIDLVKPRGECTCWKRNALKEEA